MKIEDLLIEIVKERPVGTENNEKIIALLKEEFLALGCSVTALPFKCLVWKKGSSTFKIGDIELKIEASPYSAAFDGTGEGIVIDELAALQTTPLRDKIIILRGEATQKAMQPKDYPFYYPDEDRNVILRLENERPKAILALTGQSQLSGMNPFPMFTDGNFSIPSGYMSESKWEQIRQLWPADNKLSIRIVSENIQVQSSQLIAHKEGVNSKETIVVCAHMDTQYETMGALDNATGIAILIALMQKLKRIECAFDIEFVPFNTEEYFGANGEVSYLKYLDNEQKRISLVINIDSPCHIGSNSAISYYNIHENQKYIIDQTITLHECIEKGESWYAGDHCAFAFRGISCLAVSSSDLFEGALAHIHTPKDTIKDVDRELIGGTVDFLVELVKNWSKILDK
ncbi:Zn-dependent exopeptidase M28 [Sporanaerobium hydrogeniformans]|uniref:Zn-dependent exopeptidase M28 n=1 Tax=Sporanaerobium hydrogeniformans TaxID=3072179 RepID=A0AC61D8L0_9FIRM|nr:M28 family metallopeptidase [Sporanaerobium hydrogeniformans]PHV69744.1 Zn-dependent exopeptidase M28 [Sporanaerobium hydrogeniformans]